MAKKKKKGVLVVFLLLLVAAIAYYLALFANTLNRMRKWLGKPL